MRFTVSFTTDCDYKLTHSFAVSAEPNRLEYSGLRPEKARRIAEALLQAAAAAEAVGGAQAAIDALLQEPGVELEGRNLIVDDSI